MGNEREPKKVMVDVGSGEWVRMLCGATYHIGGYESDCHCASIREAFEAGGLAFESVALEAASEKSKADNEEIANLREELAAYRKRVHGGEECPGDEECVICRGEAATCIVSHNENRAELEVKLAAAEEELEEKTKRLSEFERVGISMTKAYPGAHDKAAIAPVAALIEQHRRRDEVAYIEGLRDEARRERDEERSRHSSTTRSLQMFKDKAADSAWEWQGDGDDDLSTLACPVMIAPSDLQSIIAERDTHKARADAAEADLSDAYSYLERFDPDDAPLGMPSIAEAVAARADAACHHLRDVVRRVAGSRKGYCGDHHVFTPQIEEAALDRWQAFLASPGATTEAEQARGGECEDPSSVGCLDGYPAGDVLRRICEENRRAIDADSAQQEGGGA